MSCGCGWSVTASEYKAQLDRLWALFADRPRGKTLETRVAEVMEENRLMYRWNAELRQQLTQVTATPAAPQPATAPVSLGDDWTRGT